MRPSAGYSGTPLVTKLGLQPTHRAAVIGAPEGFVVLLGQEVEVVKRLDGLPPGRFEFLHLFAVDRATLASALSPLRDALDPAGMLWVSWPKTASGVRSDVNENVIRELALARQLVDVKVCAIDEVWSGLKLVIPRSLRPRR